MLHRLGISDSIWRRMKLQMTAVGYFSQRRVHAEDGRIGWVNEVTADEPVAISTIPLKSTDGGTTYGSAMRAEPTDKAVVNQHTKKNRVSDAAASQQPEENVLLHTHLFRYAVSNELY